MDELEFSFLQPMFNSESEFFNQSFEIESLPQQKEQTAIDTRHQEQKPQQTHNEMTNRRTRDDNTIFKTPLSQFRKIMKKTLKSNLQCIEIINSINEKKNSSTFLKLFLLSQRVGVKDQLKMPFCSQMENVLLKKKNKLQKNRFEELQKMFERMKSCLDCDNISDAMEQYWGKHRQRAKFSDSFKELEKFEKFLETTNFTQENINNKNNDQ